MSLTKDIVNEFVNFYYQCINANNIDAILKHIKIHSVFIRNGTHFKGPVQITKVLHESYKPNMFVPMKMDFLLNGDRRANIVVSGITNNQRPFNEYIQLAFGNDKSYWIHSTIFQSL